MRPRAIKKQKNHPLITSFFGRGCRGRDFFSKKSLPLQTRPTAPTKLVYCAYIRVSGMLMEGVRGCLTSMLAFTARGCLGFA